MEQFVLNSWLVHFVVDNFRFHRYLLKKHHEEVDFLCFFFTDVNSSQKAISFQVFLNSWHFVATSWCKDMQWKYSQKWMFLKSAKIIEEIVILLRVKRSY